MTYAFRILRAFPCPIAELGSDEDDLDEEGQEYLEMLARKAGEDGDDEDWEEDDAEETALEGFTTSVDDEDNLVDEYQIFKAILQSEWSQTAPLPTLGHVGASADPPAVSPPPPADIQTRDPVWYQALTQALNEEQGKHLQDIATLADQRRAAHGEHLLRLLRPPVVSC